MKATSFCGEVLTGSRAAMVPLLMQDVNTRKKGGALCQSSCNAAPLIERMVVLWRGSEFTRHEINQRLEVKVKGASARKWLLKWAGNVLLFHLANDLVWCCLVLRNRGREDGE